MALEEKDKIKGLFSSKLKDFEADLPDSIWSDIDKALSEQPVIVSRPVARRIPLRKIISVAASLIGTIVIASALLYLFRPGNSAQRATESFNDNELRGTAVIAEEKEESQDDVFPSWNSDANVKQEKQYTRPVSEKKNNILGLDKVSGQSMLLCEVQLQNKRNLGGIVNVEKGVQTKKVLPDNNVLTNAKRVILPTKKSESRDMFLSLSSGSGMLASDVNGQSNMNVFASKNHPDVPESFSDQIIDLDHNQPISFGLLINKQISSRISLETGLTYTYLSSRFKSKAYPDDVSGKTNFHYLGVPIHINYNFLQLGKANFYVSLGGEIEKDIQGRLKWSVKNDVSASSSALEGSPLLMDSGETNYALFSERTNIHQDKLQFSAHMSVGASYPIYQKLYVYGTIGGAYYFDAKNEYPTIYSDKKVQLDMNLGLKWKF